ncbi:uncharacterized protein PHA67_023238 [Liasis olivaceus]
MAKNNLRRLLKEQDKLRRTILKVGRDCKTSGFQPKDGSICLKLTVVAGVSVNFGVGYEKKDEKKNSEKESKSNKNEDGKQNRGQQKILTKYQGEKQQLEQQKKKLKDLRKT